MMRKHDRFIINSRGEKNNNKIKVLYCKTAFGQNYNKIYDQHKYPMKNLWKPDTWIYCYNIKEIPEIKTDGFGIRW